MEDLIKLDKNQIIKDNNKKGGSPLLVLGLIRNDISDLIYLHDLFIKDSVDVKNLVNSRSGQYAGRKIYVIRLILSHYYEFLVFLDKKKKEISSDDQLKKIFKILNKDDLELWNHFISLSSQIEDKKIKTTDKNINTELKVALLAKSIRGGLTFHYWHASVHINKGFKTAFTDDEENSNNKFPYATEERSVYKDRAYYIDLSMQKYLEKEVSLNEDIFLFEKSIVNTISNVNLILNKILNNYHKNISL
ncbi:MAG: hypothetical protein KBD10_02115 [Candidatus Pacebacteria bacterium]|nr:hypothetical protein [Candidatus Paceibacterota bacterium]